MPKLKTHNEYIRDLLNKNESYKNGEFRVVGIYKNKSSKILLKNKYGYCISIANNLLKNYTLNIRSALHPNEYIKEMFREVHGYRYDYSLIDYQTAKEWAEEYLNSEEGKLEIERINKEAIDYMLYGIPTSYLNEDLLDEIKNFKDEL